MRTPEYTEYIHSPEWQTRRIEYFQTHPKTCQRCQGTDDIQLHHQTYVRLGRERDGDLVALCRRCHKDVHDYQKSHPGISIAAATRQVLGISRKPRQRRPRPVMSADRISNLEAGMALGVAPFDIKHQFRGGLTPQEVLNLAADPPAWLQKLRAKPKNSGKRAEKAPAQLARLRKRVEHLS